MELRRAGDNEGAKNVFQKLLEQNPKSGGALEGLTLTSMSLGLYKEALTYIERWEALGSSDYIKSLKANVMAKLYPQQAPEVPLSTATAAPKPVSLYTVGMDLRKRGDYKGAKQAFQKLLEENPDSGGALEGLTLTSLALDQNEEALDYATRWEKLGNSAYIQSMKARAAAKLGRRGELAASLLKGTQLSPTDLRAARRLDDIMRSDASGIFPYGAMSKTHSQEGLGTRSVNKIIYESRSIGTDGRTVLRPGLSLLSGAKISQTAQRNGTRNTTYFDILEQVYSLGAEAVCRRGGIWAKYGHSLLSDIKAVGVGRKSFARYSAGANLVTGRAELRALAERSPYYLRGTDASTYFALLRENSYRLEAEAPLWGLGWLARAGISDYTGGVTVNSQSLSGTLEGGSYLVSGSISRSAQEYFGAGPTGKLTIMPYQRAGLRGRIGTDGRWLAAASYGYTAYRDGNRQNDAGAELQVWVPKTGRLGQLWGSYDFTIEEYKIIADGYRTSDKRGHWSGVFWKRQWGTGPWTQAGYEHGFLVDTRGRYEGNRWTGEIEWYRGLPFSLTARARYSNTSVGDQGASGGFSARWTF